MSVQKHLAYSKQQFSIGRILSCRSKGHPPPRYILPMAQLCLREAIPMSAGMCDTTHPGCNLKKNCIKG